MRNFQYVIRGFLAATAITTMIGCEDEVVGSKVDKVATFRSVAALPLVVPTLAVAPPMPEPIATAPKEAKIVDGGVDPDDDEGTTRIADARRALDLGELDRALKIARVAVKKEPARSAACPSCRSRCR